MAWKKFRTVVGIIKSWTGYERVFGQLDSIIKDSCPFRCFGKIKYNAIPVVTKIYAQKLILGSQNKGYV